MRLVFLGPPGSGKGTQAGLVGEKLGVPQISTGDILRESVALKTDLGEKARSYMESGRLVPDDIMLSLVDKRIGEADCTDGFVLDGFPRTLAQALGIEEILSKRGEAIDAVVFIDVDDEVVLGRLSRRRVCPQCKALYNLEADPPRKNEKCDRCGVELVLRADDKQDTVRTRLGVYRNDTLPLDDYYDSRGLLRTVDGNAEIQDVFSAVIEEIVKVGKN
jgi:adenylate kinase